MKPFADEPDIKEDVPVTLVGVNLSDDFEGAIEQRRTIIYTLSFDMKTNFYGPAQSGPIIREVNVDLNTTDTEEGFVERLTVTPDPIDVSPNDDYGFNLEINDARPS